MGDITGATDLTSPIRHLWWGNRGPPKIYPSEPQNMTRFGVRIFAAVIKVRILRPDLPGLQQALHLVASVLIRDQKEDTWCREEGHVKSEVGLAVMWPQIN